MMKEGIDKAMATILVAVEEADLVFFVVDAQAGLTSADQMIAKHLRVTNKSAILVVNKVDGQNQTLPALILFSLGLSIFG